MKKLSKVRNGFEKVVQESLKKLKGFTVDYEPVKVPYTLEANYVPDFVISKGKRKKPKKDLTLEDLRGSIFLETKGYYRLTDLRKMLAVKKSNPWMDIRFLFQKNGYVYPRKDKTKRRTKDSTDMKYGDWCDKHGFPWAVGNEIPEDWVK